MKTGRGRGVFMSIAALTSFAFVLSACRSCSEERPPPKREEATEGLPHPSRGPDGGLLPGFPMRGGYRFPMMRDGGMRPSVHDGGGDSGLTH